jgi:hypothetical protein
MKKPMMPVWVTAEKVIDALDADAPECTCFVVTWVQAAPLSLRHCNFPTREKADAFAAKIAAKADRDTTETLSRLYNSKRKGSWPTN